jgi:hypothetical protein
MTDVGARPGDSPATRSADDPASDDSAPRQTVAIPRPVVPPPAQSTVVIEDGVIPRRLRRPLDLARFLVALAATAATVLIAYFATSTTEGN